MYFDLTLGIISTNFGEYSNSEEHIDYKTKFVEVSLKREQVKRFHVKKDPVKDNICIYTLNLLKIDNSLVLAFKNKMVDYITIKIGNQDEMISDRYNLFIVELKPINCEFTFPDTNLNTDLNIVAVSSLVHVLTKDRTLGAEVINSTSMGATKIITADNTEAQVTNTVPTKNSVIDNGSGSISYKLRDFKMRATASKLSHSQINNNPGNIMTSTTEFRSFATKEDGIQAMLKDMRAKYRGSATSARYSSDGKTRTSVNTLEKLISIWAPPNHANNDTNGYIDFVSRSTGIPRNVEFPESALVEIAKAMVTLEGYYSDNYYTSELFDNQAKAIGLSGFDKNVELRGNVSNIDPRFYTKPGKQLPSVVADAVRPLENAIKSVTNAVNRVAGQVSNAIESAGLYSFTGDKKGSELIEGFIAKLSDTFGLVQYKNGTENIGASNFLYKDICLPGLTTFELFKFIQKNYPPYYLEMPWILDDMRFGVPDKDQVWNEFLGKTAYTEINILNRKPMVNHNLSSLLSIKDAGPQQKNFMLMDINYFYPEDTVRKFYGTNFIHKNITTGTQTVIKAINESTEWIIPDSNVIGENGKVERKVVNIKTLNNELIETNYTGDEFKTRIDILLKHIKSTPRLFHCKIKSDNPNLIQFGRNYDIDIEGLEESKSEIAKVASPAKRIKTDSISDGNSNSVPTGKLRLTPYKISLEFINKKGEFELNYEVIFYEGADILSI